MTRKAYALLVSCALLAACLSAFPTSADAVAATKVVLGHDLAAAKLQEFRVSCADVTPDNPPAATPLVARSGTIGTHSIGWQTPAGYEAGALAPVLHPESLSVFSGDVMIPSGSGTGHAVAFYYNAAIAPGYWIGYRSLTFAQAGFGTFNLAASQFSWYYVDPNGSVQVLPGTNTLAGFTGGDPGQGAYVGILMGCEGQPYYLDNLRVADAVDQTTYDFEGSASATRLQWSTDGKKVGGGNLSVGYGSKFWMLGDTYDPRTGGYVTGQGTLLQKPYGAATYTPVGAGSFDPHSYAAFKLAPTRETSYLFTTDGTDAYNGSGSAAVTVKVGAGVSGQVNTLSLKPGARAVITGRLKPGNRGTKVSLQRKIGGWVTVGKTKTGRGGHFSLGLTARQVGQLVLRLSVAPNDGNLGTKTNSIKVEVTPRPKPPTHHPNHGGHGGHGDPGPSSGTTSTDETATDAGSTAPGPGDVAIRLLGRAKVLVVPEVTEPAPTPTCTMPGAYPLAPCPPTRSG